MARATEHVIGILREAVALLSKSEKYQWGHMGSCNCGFLAQAVTRRSAREIHAAAMSGHGDWSEQLNDYCPSSGYPMDELISLLLDAGFERDDLARLERLSDPVIIVKLSGERNLRHNLKEDVLIYFRAWLSLLEDQWAAQQPEVIILPGELPGKAEHQAVLEDAVLINKAKPFLATLEATHA